MKKLLISIVLICLMIISGCQQGVPEQKSPGHVSEYYFYGYSYDEIGNVLEDKGLLTEEMDDFLKSIDEKTYNDLIEDKVDFEQVMNDLNKDNPKWSANYGDGDTWAYEIKELKPKIDKPNPTKE